MVFSSPIFFFFFLPAVCLLYFSFRSTAARNTVLIGASIVFYAWGELFQSWVLLANLLLGYLGSRYVAPRDGQRRPVWLLASFVGLLLSLLIYFKYSAFLTTIIDGLFHTQWHSKEWISKTLPLGISFFTFQAISYLADVYRGVVKPAPNLKNFAVFLCLFPHLIAGPIVRYRHLRLRIERRSVHWAGINRGLCIFIAGLSSKILIANPLGNVASKIFKLNVEYLTTAHAWLGAFAYTFQIYFDFQGYSLMAIGLAAIFGLKFPINFNNPYQANGIADFWRRWHISLSTWLRDYIYRPLRQSKSVFRIKPLAVMITFFLSGLWHGANWNFVLWGLYHGALRVAELHPWYRRWFFIPYIGKITTFLLVTIGWVIFQIEKWQIMPLYLKTLFLLQPRPVYDVLPFQMLLTPDVITVFLVAAALSFSSRVSELTRMLIFQTSERYRWVSFMVAAVCLVLSLSFMAAQTFNPFIYFRF